MDSEQANPRGGPSASEMPHTTTNSGLHEFVKERVLKRYAKKGLRAADLGSGPGAMAVQLQQLGCEVVAADRDASDFDATIPHLVVDFNQTEFASVLGRGTFHLVTAIEVIEHVESPIGFLRNVGELLAPRGIAVLTTPNVDSLPARLKFFLSGTIRTMDEKSEPTHISPLFWDLFVRQYLRLARVSLREHLHFPEGGFQLTRPALAGVLKIAGAVLPGENLLGDNHVLVLEAAQ